MKDQNFGITNELYGYERFITHIIDKCNDKVFRKLLSNAWNDFQKEQTKREDVLPGWGMVETLCIDDNGKVMIGLS